MQYDVPKRVKPPAEIIAGRLFLSLTGALIVFIAWVVLAPFNLVLPGMVKLVVGTILLVTWYFMFCIYNLMRQVNEQDWRHWYKLDQ